MKYLALFALAFLVACGGGSDEKKNEKPDENDSTEVNEDETNDSTANVSDEVLDPVVKNAVENPEEMSIEQFEKVNETGLSFCDCVKKAQEYDDIMLADDVSDEAFDQAMADKDKLISGDCKVLKMGGQESPEERAERQYKVKACLSK